MTHLAPCNQFGQSFAMPRKKPLALPNRIKEWRKAAGLSLEELAHRVGSTDATLSRYENGRRSITIDLLVQLAPHLGCRPADLLPDPEASMTGEERRLLGLVRRLGAADRQTLERFALAMAQTPIEAAPAALRRHLV